MKKGKFVAAAFSLATVLSLAGCGGDKAVDSLVIESGLDYTYYQGTTPSFDDLKVKVKWNDGSVTYIGEDDLTISPFSTQTLGNKKVTFSYKGKSVEVTLKVTADADEVYQVNLFDTPVSLKDRNGNLNIASSSDTGFNDKDNPYVIGDDNAFSFLPQIKLLNTDTQTEMIYGKYTSVSTVYLKVNNEYVELKDSNADNTLKLSTYVAIDEEESTYDFTDAAIGKAFKLVVRPKHFPIGPNGEEHKQELEFEVVDGYNVDEAYELGVMTNYEYYAKEDPTNIVGNVAIMKEHLVSKGAFASVDDIPDVNGIVLHNNLTLTTSDLPRQWFVVNNSNNEIVGLQDWLDIYAHYTAPGEEFNFYGNYFNIDLSELPLVAETDFSHTQLFRIAADTLNQKNASKAKSTFVNVGFTGNSPNADSAEYGSGDGLRGLMLYKINYHEATLENMWAKDFYIVGNAQASGTVLNLNNYKSTNAYQNHLFIFGSNENWSEALQDDDPTLYGPRVNITNSVFKFSGGPAIMSQHKMDAGGTSSKHANAWPIVTMDDNTVVDASTYGQEAWYTNTQAGTVINPIKTMIQLLQNQVNDVNSFKFVNQKDSTNYVNFHTITMVDGYGPASGYVTGVNGGIKYQTTNAQNESINFEEYVTRFVEFGNAKTLEAVFTSSNGGAVKVAGIGATQQGLPIVNAIHLVPVDGSSTLEAELEKFKNAEYINMFWFGMMMTFASYN